MAEEGKADRSIISSPNWTLSHRNHPFLLPGISGRVYVSNGKFQSSRIIPICSTPALNSALGVDTLRTGFHTVLPGTLGAKPGEEVPLGEVSCHRRGAPSPKPISLSLIFTMRI